MTRRKPVLTADCIALLWVASLFLPAAEPVQDAVMWGWDILLIGWLGVLTFQFAWLANLLIIPAVVMIASRKPRKTAAGIVGGFLVLSAVSALFWRKMYYDNGSRPIETFHVGYYFWMAAVVSAGSLLVSRAVAGRVWTSIES